MSNVKFWLCREMHPADSDDGAVYVCKTEPKKGFYQNKLFWFWTTEDVSDKIKISAGISFQLKIAPGACHKIMEQS